jgi:pantoate--beta-alanine ligase
VRKSHLAGEQVGLVPTMGALHAGHLSLVDASRRDCQLTVVSIFVNPTQFGPGEDFTRYPRTLNADLRLLADRGADVVFAPDTAAVYRPGNATKVEVAGPALNLEGAFRPTHFSGVATIVLKLFNLVQPDKAYFGRKDFQQSLVVQRMADDLDLPIEVVVCPIIREPDGLAMSSRNIYLSAVERQRALAISQALQGAVARVANGEHDSAKLIAEMEAQLKRADLQIDYVAIAARDTLEPLPHVDRPAVALIAARCGATRLIDNELLG